MEVSIVLPALNEENSIGKTIKELKETLSKHKASFEIIVVDSDSEDKTAIISKNFGARVVNEPRRGYGNALRRGFKESKGKYIIMCDPDGSYDARTLPKILNTLKEGYDYVNCNRFAKLNPESMSKSHYIGNAIINSLGNFFFHTKGKDMLSGYKGFRADALKKLDLRCQKWDLSMEIHSKIKSNDLKFKEIPTRYFPRIGQSKLTGLKGAWDNFRYMSVHKPNFVLIYPSLSLMGIGIVGIFYMLLTKTLGNALLMLSATTFLIGFQTFLLGTISQTIMFKRGIDKKNLIVESSEKLNLQKGIIIGSSFFVISIIVFLLALRQWLKFGTNLFITDIKFVIPGFIALIMSVSVITYSFVNEAINE